MNKKTLQKGFAHPLLLAFLLIGVVGVVGFSGYRVLNEEQSEDQAAAVLQAQDRLIIGATSSDENTQDTESQKNIYVASSGSAAESPALQTNASEGESETSQQATSLPSTKQVEDKYSATTPLGSLGQLIYEVKSGNYENALYFITPSLLQGAYNAIQATNLESFESLCSTNSVCETARSLNYDLSLTDINIAACSSPAYDSYGYDGCKKIWTKFTIDGDTLTTHHAKAVGYGVHSASVTMIKNDSSSTWLIDRVSVDGFEL